MPLASWALWLLLTAVAAAASVLWYRRRETRGRGRLLLAVLRATTISLLLLLLFDPELPRAGMAPSRGTRVLLDASLSMTLPDGGSTRWADASRIARSRADDRAVLLFGDDVRPAMSTLPDSAPGDAHSRLLPALQAAAEGGARRVVVITDGGIEDAADVARWAPRLGLDIEFETVGSDVANRSLVEASAPAWAQAGEPVPVEFGVGIQGAVPDDSITVIARRDARVIGRLTVAAPAPGRVATGTLQLRLDDAAVGGGPVRVELALEGEDAVPDDDTRTLQLQVGQEPAGIALVSFVPDWEPRFLAPVLEDALGLPVRAFLRGATGRYLRLAGGLEAGAGAPEEEVRRAVERAELVVFHGLGDNAPAWAFEAARSARQLLIFPADGAGEALPVEVGAEQQADFWPVPAVPPSPVAPLLAGLELGAVPPLSALRPAEVPVGSWVPLHVTRGREGAPLPAAIAGGQDGRRWVVALGSGYWQWAFRGGAERHVYERLWSALAGWLASDPATAGGAAVRPAQPVLPRAVPVPWLAPGLALDSLAVTLTDPSGAVVLDTVVTGDTAFTRAPAPGTYSYRARAYAGDEITGAEGELTVEAWSPELTRPRAQLNEISGRTGTVRGGQVDRGRGTPLHATPIPYVLLILTMAAEWVLRRRWGLR